MLACAEVPGPALGNTEPDGDFADSSAVCRQSIRWGHIAARRERQRGTSEPALKKKFDPNDPLPQSLRAPDGGANEPRGTKVMTNASPPKSFISRLLFFPLLAA